MPLRILDTVPLCAASILRLAGYAPFAALEIVT